MHQVDLSQIGTRGNTEQIQKVCTQFASELSPIESGLLLFSDDRTKAVYLECHISAHSLINSGTIDVPLDPDDQAEYRANRDLVQDHAAYLQMQEDAVNGRSFSNLVAEYISPVKDEKPLKIIGGQHRFEAIKSALDQTVNKFHGIKVYFCLDKQQRLDVQMISNTNIAVSSDLLDRMLETVSGPELRQWCQSVGFLEPGSDFSDRRGRGKQISVRVARTFIMNYFAGREIDAKKFDETETVPMISSSGANDPSWLKVRNKTPSIWKDKDLIEAGKEFANLIIAQREYFATKAGKSSNPDFSEKATNFAVVSAWSFVAGMIANNAARKERHFKITKATAHDPLNAAVLSKGRHKTDSENYRGLGYRTDAKERARFVELFFLQAEKGSGISSGVVDVAIKKYHAKQAVLEVKKAEEKAT